MNLKRELFRLKHDEEVNCVRFHNDLIISTSWDKTTRIWKITGEHFQIMAHKGGPCTLDISPSGEFIAVGHENGVEIWSLTWPGRSVGPHVNKVAELELGDVADVRFQTDHKIVAVVQNGSFHLITSDLID